jgi:hypothetical protein
MRLSALALSYGDPTRLMLGWRPDFVQARRVVVERSELGEVY